MSEYPRKLARPVAACVRCGRVHTAAGDTTVVCIRVEPDGSICGGRIAWRTNPEDRTECPQCKAIGMVDGAPCPRCFGDGWLMGSAG